MTKKEEVLACVQWLITTVPDKRETGATTQEIAEKMQMQRSNISTLLNELVQEGKLEKLSGGLSAIDLAICRIQCRRKPPASRCWRAVRAV